MLDAIKTHWLAFIAILLLLAFPLVMFVVFIVGKVSPKAAATLTNAVDAAEEAAAGTTPPPT